MYEYLLFDMDGTLNDSGEGITRCVQYALQSFGIDEPDLSKLSPFIGPPLIDSFMRYYNMSREEAVQATKKYRERFSVTGIFENTVYDGIPEMLDSLQQMGRKMIVASSKPEKYVRIILDHFQLTDYFYEIVGATMDEKRTKKIDVINEVFDRLGLDRESEADRSRMPQGSPQ